MMLASRFRCGAVAVRATMILCVVLFANSSARAQVPSPAPGAPEPVRWQGNAVVSIALQAGVSDQRTLSISADAFRRSPGGWSFAFQADHTHASFKIGEEFQTVADSQNARFTAERDLTEVVYFVIRPAFKRNEVQGVDHRYEGLVGLGARLLRTPRALIDVLGAAGFVNQEKGVPEVDGTDGVAGVVQTSQFVLSSMWRLSELALYLRPFDSNDYRMQFQTSLVGAIAGPLALSVAYSMDRENIVLGGSETTDRKLTIGVQVNF
jgi:hypothetical protein